MAAAAFVINNGKQIITNRMIGGGTDPKFIQWGAGAATALVSDVGLQTPTGTEVRTNGTSSQQAGAQTLSKYQVVGTIVSLSAQTINEVALFDGAGAGGPPPSGANCFVHASHGSTVLAIGESIAYTITVDFTP